MTGPSRLHFPCLTEDSSGESHTCQDFCSASYRANWVSLTSSPNKQRTSMWEPKPCSKCSRTTPAFRSKCKSSKPSSTKVTKSPTPFSPSSTKPSSPHLIVRTFTNFAAASTTSSTSSTPPQAVLCSIVWTPYAQEL